MLIMLKVNHEISAITVLSGDHNFLEYCVRNRMSLT